MTANRNTQAVIRYAAFCELLASPDLPDLPARAHRHTWDGNVARKDRIKRDLAAAYLGYRMQMHGEEGAVLGVRHAPLRLIKKTA